jgi:hypothetical protein
VKRAVVPVVVALASLGSAPAGAAHRQRRLTNLEAWYETRLVARGVYLHTQTTTGYSVVPPSQCGRRSRTVVDCGFNVTSGQSDGSTITCDGTVRVTLTRQLRITGTLLGTPTCHL